MPSVVRAQDADDGVAADVVVAGGNRIVDRGTGSGRRSSRAGSAIGNPALANAAPALRKEQLIKRRRAWARSTPW